VDDIISLILVFIIYLAAAGSGKKKRKKQKERRERAFAQMRRRQSGPLEQQEKPAQPQQIARAAQSKKTAIQQELEKRAAVQPSCDTPRMHLHQTTLEQMLAAGEGEDPCHHGGAPEAGVEDSELGDVQDAERLMFAQDILRGVVMSEILTRPCERRNNQRNGRYV